MQKELEQEAEEYSQYGKMLSKWQIIVKNAFIAGTNSKYVETKFKAFLDTFTDEAPLSYIKSELAKGINKRLNL